MTTIAPAPTGPWPTSRRGRATGTLAALGVALLVAAGCSSGPQEPTPDPGGTAPAGLERFYTQPLDWGSCGRFAQTEEERSAYGDSVLECTSLEVPLDYAQPEGPTAQIAVLRRSAIDPSQRLGSLIVNPGGPGASGVSAAAGLASTVAGSETGRRFDLVGFDPRGTGASTPPIECLTGPERDADRFRDATDTSPAGVAENEAVSQRFAQLCTERSGEELLANVGTRDVARDMDVLRSALGDEQLTYLGYSYGTRIGSTYAEQFPQNVRAMVLDGALDPDQDFVDRVVEQGRGFQGAFEAFARDCATQPDCPLGPDPAQATATYQQIVQPLIDAPLPLNDGRQLSFGDAQQGTIQALYSEQFWPPLRTALGELAAGNGNRIMLLSDLYFDREPDGSYANSQDAFSAIGCVDNERITDRQVSLEAAQRYNEVAPFLDSGRGVAGSLDPCAFWPAPVTSEAELPQVQGLAPPLVISTTGDPATPYEAGVQLAQALDASLLTKEGDEHTAAFGGYPCVDEVVDRYLVDGVPAQEGQRCGPQ